MEASTGWVAAKMSTKNFNPFWAGLFVGVVFTMMVMTGSLIIYFGNVGPAGPWVGSGLLAGAVAGLAVQLIQKRAYDTRMKALR